MRLLSVLSVSLTLAAAVFRPAQCAIAGNMADFNKVIPYPTDIDLVGKGYFKTGPNTRIFYPQGDSELERNARMLAGYLLELTGSEPAVVASAPRIGDIVLRTDPDISDDEGYTVDISPDNLIISSRSGKGGFYAVQTLRKSLDATAVKDGSAVFPSGRVTDAPRFPYRGAHLDVARHFFPLDSVKRFIDIIALHNVNRFHWHLTDDQGWRVEIAGLPRLTEIGSRRDGTCVGKNFGTSDSIPHGGFYTQEEVRELVRYAADRYIDVIPEIDMPGHMVAALAAYPELGCRGEGYKVWGSWGVNDDVLCAGNDSVYAFVDKVLTEITELFPGEYVHIGGDECPKTRWENCEACIARADSLGLQTDSVSTRWQKLQTVFMAHAVDFLSGKGRKAIGWDEILEGGLPADVAVMSWRGTEGAAEAARLGHNAILTPTDYCYFNFYQATDTDNEPLAIGGYVPLGKVYSFEPVDSGLSLEEASHILGAQANMWTEYIKTFKGVEYMELPRLAALAEVQWTAPGSKDFNRFVEALGQLTGHYDLAGYSYGRHLYDPEISMMPVTGENCMEVSIQTPAKAEIRYTLDGTDPTCSSKLYSAPFRLDSTAVIMAAAFPSGERSRIAEEKLNVHKAFMKPVSFTAEPNVYGSPEGCGLAVNGRRGDLRFASGQWLGFHRKPVEALIDLGKTDSVSNVAVGVLVDTPNWIFDAREILVELSADGENFYLRAGGYFPPVETETTELKLHRFSFPPEPVRYIRITAKPEKSIPAWHTAAGEEAHLFIDEITVD